MKSADVRQTIYTVGDVITWQRTGGLLLSPSYQRRPVWQPGAKSYLIDTIVRGLPMPVIFLRELGPDLGSLGTVREVVDGQQRLRTVLSFVGGSNLTPDFDPGIDHFTVRRNHNPMLAGKGFDELDQETKSRILDYQLSAHVFSQHVDDREILQIFARMNSTGLKLNWQELRNANYFGDFKTLMYELASEQLHRWRSWRLFTEYEIARMDEVEATSEFCILMLNGVSGRTQSMIDRVYETHDETFLEADEVRQRFRYVMDSIDRRMGLHLAASPFSRRTLFYAVFATVYSFHYGLGSSLERTRPQGLPPNLADILLFSGRMIAERDAPDEVLDASSRRTTDLRARQTLVDYLVSNVRRGALSS